MTYGKSSSSGARAPHSWHTIVRPSPSLTRWTMRKRSILVVVRMYDVLTVVPSERSATWNTHQPGTGGAASQMRSREPRPEYLRASRPRGPVRVRGARRGRRRPVLAGVPVRRRAPVQPAVVAARPHRPADAGRRPLIAGTTCTMAVVAAADLRPVDRPAYYALRLADSALIPGHDEPAVPYQCRHPLAQRLTGEPLRQFAGHGGAGCHGQG